MLQKVGKFTCFPLRINCYLAYKLNKPNKQYLSQKIDKSFSFSGWLPLGSHVQSPGDLGANKPAAASRVREVGHPEVGGAKAERLRSRHQRPHSKRLTQ